MSAALQIPAPAIAPVAPAAEPVASSHLWCPVCRKPKMVAHKPLMPASRMYQPAMHGEHLVCVGCGTTIATCFVALPAVEG